MPEPGSSSELPRFYSNMINVAAGPFDVTVTFIEVDGTALPEGQDGPHEATSRSRVQVVMPIGELKAMIPLMVRVISEYEQRWGVIPAPGFEEDSKE